MDIRHLILLVQLCVELAVSVGCGKEESNEIHQKYTECQKTAYTDYKDRKRKIGVENVSSRLAVTCQYFATAADGCGEILSSCYDHQTIMDIKDHLISTRLIPDSEDVPTSHSCRVITLFNQRQSTNETTGNEIHEECSNSEIESINSGMSECYDDTIKNVHNAMENLTNKVEVSDLVCQALTNITNHCMQGLNSCFSTLYITKMRRQELQRFHPYLLTFTNGRADADTLQNCPVLNNKADEAGAQVITAPDEQEENVEHHAKSASVHEGTEATAKATYVQNLVEAGQDLPSNSTDAAAPVSVDNAVDNERITWSNPSGHANVSTITSLTILLCFTIYFLL